jgi:diguanylate cyclase (GGDEF)-like protein
MNIPSSVPLRPRFRTALFLLLSLSLTCLWEWIDYRTESEIVLSVFYLIPIGIAAWYIGEGAGIAVSLLSAAFAGYDTEIQSGLFSRSAWIGVWGIASRMVFFLLTAWLLGRLRRTMESIRRMAMADSLTNVYNARAFIEFLRREIDRSRRYKHPLSLIYLDLDNFKDVNDTYGHQTGNLVLTTVAAVLRQSVRRMDIVARLGGDEFSVLLTESDEKAAHATVERIRKKLIREAEKEHRTITVSIGAVTYHCLDCTPDDVIRKADDLMYQVKRSGKNGALFAVVRV